MISESSHTSRLLDQAATKDPASLNALFERHRNALLHHIRLRLDVRLRGRVDPSDVLQETQLEANRRLSDFLRRRPMPFAIWLKRTASERLIMLRRREILAARRSVLRELPLPEESSLAVAQAALLDESTPEERMAANEVAKIVRQTVAQLGRKDREILLMRTFEGIAYDEIGCLLGISPDAAKKRHGRTLVKLYRTLRDRGVGGSSK